MWRSRKFIIIAVLTVLVLGATLGGVAVAQADEENNTSRTENATSFLEKVAEIYQQNTGVAIDADELQKAMTEARQDLKDNALDSFLQKLVENGRITQEEADEFKAWLDARPTFPTEEFQDWWESRPDLPGLFGDRDGMGIGPFGGMHRDIGKFGMGFKIGRWCAPDAEIE